MKALISVPRTVDVVPLAQCMRMCGFNIFGTPGTAEVLHGHKIPCTLVIESFSSLCLETFAIIVISLPDATTPSYRTQMNTDDADKCAILTRAACMFRSQAALAHPGHYGQVIEELNRCGTILPSTRLALATKALYMAAEWAGHVARNHRQMSQA